MSWRKQSKAYILAQVFWLVEVIDLEGAVVISECLSPFSHAIHDVAELSTG